MAAGSVNPVQHSPLPIARSAGRDNGSVATSSLRLSIDPDFPTTDDFENLARQGDRLTKSEDPSAQLWEIDGLFFEPQKPGEPVNMVSLSLTYKTGGMELRASEAIPTRAKEECRVPCWDAGAVAHEHRVRDAAVTVSMAWV